MAQHMLTTIDNPHNPFEDFDAWYAYDTAAGYHSMAFLARIARTSHDLADAVHDQALEDAIDEIVRENVLGIYKKVEGPDAVSVEQEELSATT